MGTKRTNDADLEVIAGATKEDLFLLWGCLFGWHPFFNGSKCCRRERECSTAGEGKNGDTVLGTPSISHFQKKSPSRLRCNTASAGARLFAHARLSLSTQPLPPMKAFNALTFVFSLLSLVLGQTVTVTNAYVSLLRTFLLAC